MDIKSSAFNSNQSNHTIVIDRFTGATMKRMTSYNHRPIKHPDFPDQMIKRYQLYGNTKSSRQNRQVEADKRKSSALEPISNDTNTQMTTTVPASLRVVLNPAGSEQQACMKDSNWEYRETKKQKR